jgi:hypothetical protein
MKFFLILLFVMTAYPAFSQECSNCSQNSDVIENCEVLEPNTYDKNSRYCSGTSFGVTYKGTLSDSTCYSTIDEAIRAMKELN